MKNCFLAAAFLSASVAHAQVTVTVDVSQTLKTLNGKENGINLNYLTDGTYTSSVASTTNALKQMGIKVLRYPGGEKSDNHFFSSYPWNSSSPRMASKDTRGWPTSDARFVDVNSTDKLCHSLVLDFDEMVQVARNIEAEPLIVVPYDVMYLTYSSGAPATRPSKNELIEHAVEWVRYANKTKRYNIKYWMIGNESWNLEDYNGKTTPGQYVNDIIDFASAMKAIDPTIKIIVNGEASWWSTLLQSAALPYIDILSFSNYPVWRYSGGYTFYKDNNVNLTKELDDAISAINKYTSTADQNRIKVLPSEYNSIDWDNKWVNDNNLGHALCNFQMFGDMILKPKLESMCMWNTRWADIIEQPQSIYDALDKNGNLNANGIAQEVWGKNLLHKMVPTSCTEKMIKTYATYDTINKALNIFILNKDITSKTINVVLQKYVSQYGGARWEFSGTNTDDKAPTYKWVQGISDPTHLSNISVPPTSVTVLKLFSPFTYLPLHITTFKAEKNSAGVQLQWATENEDGVTTFVVEKSEGNNRFIPIGKEPTKGKTSVYTFLDAAYNSDASYRLKIIYADGNSSYSKIVQVKNHEEVHAKNAVIFPNPVLGPIKIQIPKEHETESKINIINEQGTVLLTQKINLSKGNNNLEISNSAGLPKGNYWLQIITKEKTQSLKFIKL